MTHLNDLSKVYLENIAESAVPGQPAERLGAVTAIPKSEQDAARERILAKTAAKRAKMKEETDIDEAVKGADTEMRRAASSERRGGDKPLSKSEGDKNAANMKRKIEFADKISKAKGHMPGYTYGEAVDRAEYEKVATEPAPKDDKKAAYAFKDNKNRQRDLKKLARLVRHADGQKRNPAMYNSFELEGELIDEIKKEKPKRWWDDDGDGKGWEEGEVSGKFKRKKKVKESNDYDPMDDDDFDHDEAEENRGVSGKNNPKGGKALGKKKKSVKEGFSNWRQDLSEVMDDTKADQKIKEKKVNNKIKINPKLGEAVEEIGATLLEMVEVDEFDFIVEGVYLELLDEGYEEEEIEEALEFALTEAKVTFGHDTASSETKKKSLLSTAREKLSGAKTAAKAAVVKGARKVAKGALGVARKIEGGDSTSKTAAKKPSTYRGAGVGTKEKVSSGSYTPPAKKKAEKPADPWEGSATTPIKAKAKKAAAPKEKAPATATKRKRKSKLDSLLADIRSEETQIDEKMNLATADMGDVIKDFQKSDAPQFKGKSKEERRQMALAAKLTAERGGKKLGEQMDDSTEMSGTSTDDKRMDQQKKKIQMQKIRDLTVRLAAARKGVY